VFGQHSNAANLDIRSGLCNNKLSRALLSAALFHKGPNGNLMIPTPHKYPKVPVYSPKGVREMHTRPNARDLVNGAGYSWAPGVPSQPAAFAPFVTMTPPSSVPQSQEVVDRVGGSLANSQPPGVAAAMAQAQAMADDANESGEGEGEGEGASEDAEAEQTEAPARRVRRPRGEA
jgi:hypothetical protein